MGRGSGSRRGGQQLSATLTEQEALAWVDQLFAIEPRRFEAARQRIERWGFAHLSRELVEPMTADSIISAVLLVESVDALLALGVPQTKLEAKLRNDPDVWPTWAEIRAAAIFARYAPGAAFVMEADKSAGRHADFSVTVDGERTSIEFKALGLSDAEAEFSGRVAPTLLGSVPEIGLVTFHMPDTGGGTVARDVRRQAKRNAVRLAPNLPPALQQTASAVIVGHNTEANYARRLVNKVKEAIEQVPSNEDCWLAFHWSNGAPMRMLSEALAQLDVPDHIRAVALVGSFGFPGRLDNFMLVLPAPFTTGGEVEYQSAVDVDQARRLFAAIERSGGVRPTLLRVPSGNRMKPLICRDGARRILPFNLVLEPDPDEVVRHFGKRGTSDRA